MSATTGLAAVGTYTGATTAGAALNILLGLIADPDSNATSGAQAGGGYLDQMSPAAAAQLRVEIAAMIAAVGTFNAP